MTPRPFHQGRSFFLGSKTSNQEKWVAMVEGLSLAVLIGCKNLIEWGSFVVIMDLSLLRVCNYVAGSTTGNNKSGISDYH